MTPDAHAPLEEGLLHIDELTVGVGDKGRDHGVQNEACASLQGVDMGPTALPPPPCPYPSVWWCQRTRVGVLDAVVKPHAVLVHRLLGSGGMVVVVVPGGGEGVEGASVLDTPPPSVRSSHLEPPAGQECKDMKREGRGGGGVLLL